MTDEEFNNLKTGDIVRNVSGNAYVITHDMGDRKIATRTMDLSNPPEWELVSKNYHSPDARRGTRE